MNNKVTFSQLNILILLFFCSCANDVYYPPMINVPVFTEKKQAKVNFNLRNLQGTASISDNMCLFYNFSYFYYENPDLDVFNESISINNEFGLVYYKNKSTGYFNILAGGGFSSFNNKYNSIEDIYEPFFTKIKYYKLFLQPYYVIKQKNEFIASFKFSFLNVNDVYGYTNIDTGYFIQKKVFMEYRQSPFFAFFLEPALTFKFNNDKDNFGFIFQPRYSFPLTKNILSFPHEQHFDRRRFILSIAFQIRILDWNRKPE